MMSVEELRERANKIKLLLMDCDGVLTDGRLYFSANGEAMKVFYVRDGQGIKLWHDSGRLSGIISGRDAGDILKARGRELGMRFVHSAVGDKAAIFNEILSETGITPDETAFIGDDVGDLELLNIVGFPAAVADAVDEVRSAACFITKANGGTGAVRELIEFLLNSGK